MRRRIVILSLLALAGSPAMAFAADKPTAEAFVQDFYRRELLPVKRGELRALFQRDLADAMVKEYGKEEPGELDFDYRFGAQDVEMKNLRLETRPTPAGADVTARFENFGKSYEIRYRLAAQGKGGWRILDISAPAQNDDIPWGLREKLGLSPAP